MCPTEKIWSLLEEAVPEQPRNWNWNCVADKQLSAFDVISKLRTGGIATGTPGLAANLAPRPPQFKKTLVLDVDETLVQLVFKRIPGIDTYMVATSSQDDSWAYVYFRPFVHEFLAICAGLFEVIAFTAGNQEYADQVLDALDPKGKFFSGRVYRESCFKYEDQGQFLYTKDLRVLGRDLAEVILVDNSILSFAFQTDNGLLVQDFDPGKNPNDKELPHILPILKSLGQDIIPDVRPLIRKGYKLEEQVMMYMQRSQSCHDAHWVSPVAELSAGLPSQAQQQPHTRGVSRSSSSPNLRLREVGHRPWVTAHGSWAHVPRAI